ncbi:MAG: hypothetical protein AM1032_000251 [Mycoplasmataceae bacterium]|nr:MAG: hypothetical protein AM1032_000251 [Mycoplasmataceae bacterium]
MEKKFFTEVTILLLPPLFNQINFKNNGTFFLGLNEIAKTKDLFSNLKIEEKKDYNSFVKKINEEDFSENVIEIINKEIDNKKVNSLNDLNVILVNYPINKNQFISLESKLESFDIKISKMIISNLSSFDILTKTKSKNFLCPICLKSYDREINFFDNEYICPLDDEKFSISQINKFTSFFTDYYLHNSLEVIQNFADSEKEEKHKKRKMFPLTIESEDNIEENLKKDLINIIKD